MSQDMLDSIQNNLVKAQDAIKSVPEDLNEGGHDFHENLKARLIELAKKYQDSSSDLPLLNSDADSLADTAVRFRDLWVSLDTDQKALALPGSSSGLTRKEFKLDESLSPTPADHKKGSLLHRIMGDASDRADTKHPSRDTRPRHGGSRPERDRF